MCFYKNEDFMSLISSDNLLGGGLRQELNDLESSARDFANNLSRKKDVTLSDMVQLQGKIRRLEQRSEMDNALLGTIHRIIMSIIQSMKHA
jgi:hypothetical protein